MGYVLVSRTGDEGWTCWWNKLAKWSLIRYWKGCWSIPTVGWWSWKLKFAKECVIIHLPNGVAPKMDFAEVNQRKSTASIQMKREVCRSVWMLTRCSEVKPRQIECSTYLSRRSNYSSGNFEDRSGRRISCEQRLHMGWTVLNNGETIAMRWCISCERYRV